jgi:eukaryotic-like serine/threonine-protein kinase
MEWLEGESLGARLKRELRLSTSATGTILRQVARGLRSAHELGVVHRDLKPDNLFLQRDHDEEIVKILDFGVAKARGQTGEQTRTGVILGSLRYMSPEQARANRDTDHRSDLWSLGVIAYRCLTGELPFSGNSDGDSAREHLHRGAATGLGAPAHARSARRLLRAVFAKDPGARFGSAAELASAYFAALGVDDPSKRTVSPEAARSLVAELLAAPACGASAAGPGRPTAVAPPRLRPRRAHLPARRTPEAAIGTRARDDRAIGSGPCLRPWRSPGRSRERARVFGRDSHGCEADPASRSAILVASMPATTRSSSKLGLAIGIGGAVGVLLALGSLVVLLSTGSGARRTRASAARGAERGTPQASHAAAARPPHAADPVAAVVEPSVPAGLGLRGTSPESTESMRPRQS